MNPFLRRNPSPLFFTFRWEINAMMRLPCYFRAVSW